MKIGNGKEPPARDSGELLRDMKRTYSDPLIPVVTDEEFAEFEAQATSPQSIPPSSGDDLRNKQITAWNNMAEQMIKVVKTIKLNEQRLADTEVRVRRLVSLVAVIVVVAGTASLYFNVKAIASTERVERETMSAMELSRHRQDKLLEVVAGLAEAQAVGIEADFSYDPKKEREAKAAALETQQMALQVRVDSVPQAEKPEVEEKLQQVKEKAEQARADVPSPPKTGD